MISIIYILSLAFLPSININRRSIISASISSPLYKNIIKNEEDNNNGLIRSVNNNIFFSGGLNEETIFAISSNIINLQNEDNINEINLHIQSKGGSLLPSLGLVDLIRNSPTPINTYVTGYAASAASLIAIVGNKRYINKYGVILVHQLQMGLDYSKYKEIQDNYYNAETLMNIIKDIYLDYSKLSLDELNNLLDHDYWLNSTTCLNYGLIDKIL